LDEYSNYFINFMTRTLISSPLVNMKKTTTATKMFQQHLAIQLAAPRDPRLRIPRTMVSVPLYPKAKAKMHPSPIPLQNPVSLLYKALERLTFTRNLRRRIMMTPRTDIKMKTNTASL
jgi:hypothetical protein